MRHSIVQTPHILISIRVCHFTISFFNALRPLPLIFLSILLNQSAIPIKQVILKLGIDDNPFDLEGKSTISMFLPIFPLSLIHPPIKICHLPKSIPQPLPILSFIHLSTSVLIYPITMFFVFEITSPINVPICTFKTPLTILLVSFELPRIPVTIGKHISTHPTILVVFPLTQIAVSITKPVNTIPFPFLTILRVEFTPIRTPITKPLNLNTTLEPPTSLCQMVNLKLLSQHPDELVGSANRSQRGFGGGGSL